MTDTSRRRPTHPDLHAPIWTGAYFLSPEIASVDLGYWDDVLPDDYRILGANLFADVFIEDARGRIHMLEVAADRISMIADSRELFLEKCLDDWNGWLLRPLVDRCRELGMMPGDEQCFAMTTLPRFGGSHEVGNLWLCDWRSWIGYAGFVRGQNRDLEGPAPQPWQSVEEKAASALTWRG